MALKYVRNIKGATDKFRYGAKNGICKPSLKSFLNVPSVVSQLKPQRLESTSVYIFLLISRIIRTNTEYEDVTTFGDVCPTSNNRKAAALMFSALLSE